MKSWIREVRALTASMVALRAERARLVSRCCELRGGLPLGSAQFLLHLGLSRSELLAMRPEAAAWQDDVELVGAAEQLRHIDGQIEDLERRVRTIAAAAHAAEDAHAADAATPAHAPANVVPFRQRARHLPVVASLVEVA